MPVQLDVATAGDASDLVSLHVAVNESLTVRYGKGPWSSGPTEKGVLFTMRTSTVYVAKNHSRLVATLTISTRKPWAIDKTYFADSKRPLYLTGMAVRPGEQRKGIGRECIAEARRLAIEWPGDAIRLDAWDAEAGDFYRKCGFREVGRASYRNSPLIYFEMLL
jgi:GNAT superfamily N-acetyltransferase